jgi:hypothetical protein
MKNQTIVLKGFKRIHYENELRTAALVKLSYRLRCQGRSLTPEKLYALCKLTWWKGDKLPSLWVLWDKRGVQPNDPTEFETKGFPTAVTDAIQADLGIVNYYAAYRNSTFLWIRRNFRSLAPLVHRAAVLENDNDARVLAETIAAMPGIPKPSRKGGRMSPSSLLTPLFGCLDPRHRFPLVNKARHVVNLHHKLGIAGFSLPDQFNTLIRLIGQYGIKNALMLDVASDQIARMTLPKAIDEITAQIKHANRLLDEKDDSDVEVILKTRSRKAVRLHNSMTNALTKTCSRAGFKILEGAEPYRFDALIKDYDGNGKDLLIEAKSSCDRPHLRLAVGQLLDYRRGLRRRAVTDLAILLPEKPDNESLHFLNDVGIHAVWFVDSKLKQISGNIDLTFMT